MCAYLVVPVIDDQVAPLALPKSPIRLPELVLAVRVLAVRLDLLDTGVVANDGLVVGRSGEAAGDRDGSARVVDCYLVGDGREALLARVRTAEGEGAHGPADVGHVGRPDGPRKTQQVVHAHDFILVCSSRKVDVLVEHFLRKMLAELVKRSRRHGLAHQGELQDVVEAVAPAENLERGQNLYVGYLLCALVGREGEMRV